MKITIEKLKSINACDDAIARFNNTKELHNIDITESKSISVGDNNLFNHLQWLIPILKGKLLINKLSYKNSNGYSCEYTYDERGNKLSMKDSKGYTEEYTYDERGNKLSMKNSNGYTIEYSIMKYDLTIFEIITYNK